MRALLPTPFRARRGSVIVVVLVTILLASLMIAKFMENSAVELTLATRKADRDRLRTDAYSAFETLLAVMAEVKAIDDDKLYAPEQGWGDPYAYSGESPREGVTVSFSFQDETGKASLPNMSFDDMMKLAQTLGLGEPDARRFSDGLYVWMKGDHTPQDIEAEAIRYERDDPPVTVPKRSLRSWDEMRSVRVAREYVYDQETGALTAFGAALRENISLYDFDGTNVNSLAPALGTNRGWAETQSAQIAGYRAGQGARAAGAPTWFRDVSELSSIIGANADVAGLGAEVKLLHVGVTVREGLASMTLNALVAVDDSVELPAVTEAESQTGGTTGGANNQNAGSGNNASGNNQAGGNRSNSGGNSGNSGGNGASGSSGQTEEMLDYPFGILEVVETSGPPPVVSVEEEAPQS